MSNSNTTLANLWVNDSGQASPLKSFITTPSKASSSGGDLKEEMLQFYKDTGLDTVAKEAGILDLNGELTTFKQEQTVHPKTQTIQMITVPVQSTVRSASVLQTTPKQVKVTSGSPMLISPAQQGATILQSNQIIGTPKISSPQYVATPLEISPSPNWGRKRASEFLETPDSDGKRRRSEKGGKGLRHFSMKVCEKVQKKGITSYNEVADELVAEFTDPSVNLPDQGYDQKNIRRRVYDALNVLMAMNIISKEKKEIKWIGLPANSAQECQNLETEKQRRIERIKHKTQQLQELILQQIAFKRLVERNRQVEMTQGAPTSNSAIQLPFIIVNTSKKTVIDCSISNDKYEYLFNFNNTFEIHDDIEVLKRMGLAFGLEKGLCSQADLNKAVKMVPKTLEPYVLQLAQQNTDPLASIQSTSAVPGTSTDKSLDAEVAMVTGGASASGVSRQSSIASLSRSGVETPDEDGFSDDSESEEICSPILEI